MNPYLVLKVPLDADDGTIRQAYLAAVRRWSPDTHPAEFKQVAAAYELIKDWESRCRYKLFDRSCDGESPVEAVRNHVRVAPRPRPPALGVLQEILRECAK